ncbi:alpha/beta hydrolase [Ketobacter sp.]|uniref:alpha/beta hydrolase n=1 Tax=Ketobacter sp. TaxID=2083498 RepID=UPI000F290388|nr:alpha/beta fold hydrolase [Ketobacter sp.]RLT93789.1 MAG: alpha/beta fold hydrolase [Ketobacter sp.]
MKSAWNSATIFNVLKSRVLIYGALSLFLVTQMSACSSYFFYPSKKILHTPDEGGLVYEDVVVKTRDHLSIHGWLLPAQQPKGIVFFLHGNAENISTHINSVYWLPEQGYDVLLMDYRGYGRSQGSPDFPDVFLDVDAMYRWLEAYARDKQLPVYVLGQSLGAAISSVYFSQLPPDQRIYRAVALDAVFAGHRDIAKDVLDRHVITWPLQFIVPWFLPTEYNPKDHVADFSPVPLLFIHSPEDQIIPFAQGQTVFEQAQAPKYWVTSHGPHIATFGHPRYRRILLNFLEDPAQDPMRDLESSRSESSPTGPAQTDSSSSRNQK